MTLMGQQVQCDTATVTVSHAEAGTFTLTVPAYTVPPSLFVTRIHAVLTTYVARSLQQNEPLSVADFALHLLTVAASDPMTQERISDSTTAIPDDAGLDDAVRAAEAHERENKEHVTNVHHDGTADCDDCNWSTERDSNPNQPSGGAHP